MRVRQYNDTKFCLKRLGVGKANESGVPYEQGSGTYPATRPPTLGGVIIGLFIHYIYYVTTFPLQNKQPVVILLVDTEVTFHTCGA